jgi:hypothetical protein
MRHVKEDLTIVEGIFYAITLSLLMVAWGLSS